MPCRHDQLGEVTAQTFRLAPEELVGVPGRQARQIDFPGAEMLVEQGTHDRAVGLHRGGANPILSRVVDSEVLDPLGRNGWTRKRSSVGCRTIIGTLVGESS